MKNRTELLELLHDSLNQKVKHDKKKIVIINKNLAEYGLNKGQITKLINSDEELQQADIRLLCLLTEQVYAVTQDTNFIIDKYFTEREIKEAKTTYTHHNIERLELPYTFENIQRVSDDEYMVVLSSKDLKMLYDSGLINYNHETQREGKRKKVGDTFIEVPRTNQSRINEISELMMRDELVSSTLTLNTRLMSSDEGEELIYNKKQNTLTVTKGTLIDILDGFHRLTAIVKTLNQKPDININFTIRVLNYEENRAKTYFEQINRVEPVAKSRLEEMNTTGLSNFVATYVKSNSELRGRVSSSDNISTQSELLVTFNTLNDSIKNNFEMKDKAEAMSVAKYLTDFYNYLILNNIEAFQSNIEKIRSKSIINVNQMFHGYTMIASHFYENDISLDSLQSILEYIDFKRSNLLWKELNILDESENIKGSARKQIIRFFQKILKGVA